MLDNASQDGSVEAASRHPVTTEVIALPERQGKAANDSLLLQRARGRFCLLLNEDSELELGCVVALYAALDRDERGRRGRRDARAARTASSSPRRGASRPPAPRCCPRCGCTSASSCRARATTCGGWTGCSRRRCSCAAQRPRTSATSTPTSSSTPTRSTSASASRTPATACSTSPPPAPSTTSSCRPAASRAGGSSSSPATATATCASTTRGSRPTRCGFLTAWTYALRAVGALVLPGHNPKRYLKHVTATLFPRRGEGLREGAEEFNRRLEPPVGRVDFD